MFYLYQGFLTGAVMLPYPREYRKNNRRSSLTWKDYTRVCATLDQLKMQRREQCSNDRTKYIPEAQTEAWAPRVNPPQKDVQKIDKRPFCIPTLSGQVLGFPGCIFIVILLLFILIEWFVFYSWRSDSGWQCRCYIGNMVGHIYVLGDWICPWYFVCCFH